MFKEDHLLWDLWLQNLWLWVLWLWVLWLFGYGMYCNKTFGCKTYGCKSYGNKTYGCETYGYMTCRFKTYGCRTYDCKAYGCKTYGCMWPMVIRPMVLRPLDTWPMFATKVEVVSLPYFFYTFPKPPVFDTLENRMITLHLIFGWTIINIQANYQSSREWITPESILEHKNVKIVKDVKIDGCSVKLSCNMHLHMSFVSIRLGTISGWKQDCRIFLASFVILKRSEYFVFYMLNLCD